MSSNNEYIYIIKRGDKYNHYNELNKTKNIKIIDKIIDSDIKLIYWYMNDIKLYEYIILNIFEKYIKEKNRYPIIINLNNEIIIYIIDCIKEYCTYKNQYIFLKNYYKINNKNIPIYFWNFLFKKLNEKYPEIIKKINNKNKLYNKYNFNLFLSKYIEKKKNLYLY
jgi:hypothetical protein